MATSSAVADQAWQVDSNHTAVSFSARHLMITTVRGRLGSVTGTGHGLAGGAASVDITIDAAGVDTGNDQRDAHLRSADFLDVAVHPTIRFVSTRVDGAVGGDFKLVGNLTLHGVTREVSFAVESHGVTDDRWGNRRAGFSATGKLLRSDFGLTWNQAIETGGVVVSDEIKFSIDIAFVRPKE
jgi:polyisoprenoid-binding protein YceI